MSEMYPAIGSIALKAIAAVLVAFVGWNKDWTKWQRVAIWGIAACLLLSAVGDGILEHEHELAEVKSAEIQIGMRNSLGALEKETAGSIAARRQRLLVDRNLREGIQSLIDKGYSLRETCQGFLPSRSEIEWIKSVQEFLIKSGRPDDARAFVHSSAVFIHQLCEPRLQGYLASLGAIRADIPAD